MKLDITKLELADVLVALVNGGSTATITVHGRMPTLTHRLARELIEEAKATGSLYFDSVMGRTLNINFDDDIIDVTAYDYANGDNVALNVLKSIGEVTVVASAGIRNAMLHAKGSMSDRLADRPAPSQVDVDAWHKRFNAATPEEQTRMIHDDGIKYAYQHQANESVDSAVTKLVNLENIEKLANAILRSEVTPMTVHTNNK